MRCRGEKGGGGECSKGGAVRRKTPSGFSSGYIPCGPQDFTKQRWCQCSALAVWQSSTEAMKDMLESHVLSLSRGVGKVARLYLEAVTGPFRQARSDRQGRFFRVCKKNQLAGWLERKRERCMNNNNSLAMASLSARVRRCTGCPSFSCSHAKQGGERRHGQRFASHSVVPAVANDRPSTGLAWLGFFHILALCDLCASAFLFAPPSIIANSVFGASHKALT